MFVIVFLLYCPYNCYFILLFLTKKSYKRMLYAKGGAPGQGSISQPVHEKFSPHHWSGFASQQALVLILPRFTMRAVKGIGGIYGPFYPNTPSQVPLWLALHLRETDTCTIVPPYFMSAPYLSDILLRETEDNDNYQPLPYYYYEISTQLLRVAKKDIPDVTEVIRLLSEVHVTRKQKLTKAISGFSRQNLSVPGLTLTNLASFEIELLKNTVAPVFDHAEKLEVRSQPMNAAEVVRPVAAAAASSTNNNNDAQHQQQETGVSLSQNTTSTAVTGASATPYRGSEMGTTVAMTNVTSTSGGTRGIGSGSEYPSPDGGAHGRDLFGVDAESVGADQTQPSQDTTGRPSTTGSTTAPKKRRTLRHR